MKAKIKMGNMEYEGTLWRTPSDTFSFIHIKTQWMFHSNDIDVESHGFFDTIDEALADARRHGITIEGDEG